MSFLSKASTIWKLIRSDGYYVASFNKKGRCVRSIHNMDLEDARLLINDLEDRSKQCVGLAFFLAAWEIQRKNRKEGSGTAALPYGQELK